MRPDRPCSSASSQSTQPQSSPQWPPGEPIRSTAALRYPWACAASSGVMALRHHCNTRRCVGPWAPDSGQIIGCTSGAGDGDGPGSYAGRDQALRPGRPKSMPAAIQSRCSRPDWPSSGARYTLARHGSTSMATSWPRRREHSGRAERPGAESLHQARDQDHYRSLSPPGPKASLRSDRAELGYTTHDHHGTVGGSEVGLDPQYWQADPIDPGSPNYRR